MNLDDDQEKSVNKGVLLQHQTTCNHGEDNFKKTPSVSLSLLASGDLDEIRRVVQQGADVNARAMGMFPLFYAIQHCSGEVVELLLESKADYMHTWKGVNALSQAVLENKESLARRFLALPEIQITALTLLESIDTQSVAFVELLLNNKANVNHVSGCSYNTPLRQAVKAGNPEMVKLLLKHSASIEIASKASPLSKYVDFGRPRVSELVPLLLDLGCPLLEIPTEALRHRKFDLVKLLLTKYPSYQFTSLGDVFSLSDMELFQIILDHCPLSVREHVDLRSARGAHPEHFLRLVESGVSPTCPAMRAFVKNHHNSLPEDVLLNRLKGVKTRQSSDNGLLNDILWLPLSALKLIMAFDHPYSFGHSRSDDERLLTAASSTTPSQRDKAKFILRQKRSFSSTVLAMCVPIFINLGDTDMVEHLCEQGARPNPHILLSLSQIYPADYPVIRTLLIQGHILCLECPFYKDLFPRDLFKLILSHFSLFRIVELLLTSIPVSHPNWMIFAMKNSNLPLIRYLVKRGATNSSGEQNSSLRTAMSSGNLAIVKELIAARAMPNSTTLSCLSYRPHSAAIVNCILNECSCPPPCTPSLFSSLAAPTGKDPSLESLHSTAAPESKSGLKTPLYRVTQSDLIQLARVAIDNDDSELLSVLLAHGLIPTNPSLLRGAIRAQCLALLVEHNAPINSPELSRNPLEIAIRAGNVHALRTFLKFGAATEKNEENKQITPHLIEMALNYPRCSEIELLLAAGAQLSSTQTDNLLYQAFVGGWVGVVARLTKRWPEAQMYPDSQNISSNPQQSELNLPPSPSGVLSYLPYSPLDRGELFIRACKSRAQPFALRLLLWPEPFDFVAVLSRKSALSDIFNILPYSGGLEVISYLVDHRLVSGQELNSKGIPALEMAISWRYPRKFIQCLIEIGCDVNMNKPTDAAIIKQQWKVVDSLLEAKGQVGKDPQALGVALRAGRGDLFTLLIKSIKPTAASFDIALKSAPTMKSADTQMTRVDIVRLLMHAKGMANPGTVAGALRDGKESEACEMMCSKVQVDYTYRDSGKSLIQEAIERKYFTAAECALKCGGAAKASYLSLAISNSAPLPLIQVLLQCKADPNHFDLKKPPLHLAAQRGKLEVVKLLVQNKADLNLSFEGHTPLHEAIYMKHEQLALSMLDMGPDLSSKPALLPSLIKAARRSFFLKGSTFLFALEHSQNANNRKNDQNNNNNFKSKERSLN